METQTEPVRRGRGRPAGDPTVYIGTHIDPKLVHLLRQTALEQRRTIRAVIEEVLTRGFERMNKPKPRKACPAA